MRAKDARLFALCLAAAVTLACGGARRPPVVTATPPGGASGSTASSATAEPGQPLDAGPDVQPIQDDAASGREIVGGADGEAGPLADVHFDFDQATLSEAAQQTLRQHAGWLQRHPDLKVTIEGHCDQRGTVEYNLALGDLRAQAVREHLIGLGVAADRLATASFGKERPADHAMTEAAWAKNRRAHFVVTR